MASVVGQFWRDHRHGEKQYACIGVAANKLFAVVMVADVDVDGPAKVYCMPMANLTFDHTTGTWKTPPKTSIITDLTSLFKRG